MSHAKQIAESLDLDVSENGKDPIDQAALVELVLDLVRENEELRERVEEIEARDERRVYLTYDIPPEEVEQKPDVSLVEHIQLGEFALGKWIQKRAHEEELHEVIEDVDWLLNRVEELMRGEIDPNEIIAAAGGLEDVELIPLHRMHLAVEESQDTEHNLTTNQEIAARTFPHIWNASHSTPRGQVLPSTKLADVIHRKVATPELDKRLDVCNPHAQTVSRVMGFIADFSGGLIEIDHDAHPKQLVIDRDAWAEYTDRVNEAVAGPSEEVVG